MGAVGPDRWGDVTTPPEAGSERRVNGVLDRAGAGLGGFDEALDTGPPLPGGGDMDMFYRVLRRARLVIYLPGLLVPRASPRLPGLPPSTTPGASR